MTQSPDPAANYSATPLPRRLPRRQSPPAPPRPLRQFPHRRPKRATPGQILAHMGDLFDWALSIAQGQPAWHDSTPLPWNARN